MKNIAGFILAAAFLLSTITGCANPNYNIASLAGLNIRDLEKARSKGSSKTFDCSYDVAFDKVIEILKSNKLLVFRENKKQKYIVAIGFYRQTNTTRVGIFFEPVSDNSTNVTLSSLSSTALAKAEVIIFDELQEEIIIID